MAFAALGTSSHVGTAVRGPAPAAACRHCSGGSHFGPTPVIAGAGTALATGLLVVKLLRGVLRTGRSAIARRAAPRTNAKTGKVPGKGPLLPSTKKAVAAAPATPKGNPLEIAKALREFKELIKKDPFGAFMDAASVDAIEAAAARLAEVTDSKIFPGLSSWMSYKGEWKVVFSTADSMYAGILAKVKGEATVGFTAHRGYWEHLCTATFNLPPSSHKWMCKIEEVSKTEWFLGTERWTSGFIGLDLWQASTQEEIIWNPIHIDPNFMVLRVTRVDVNGEKDFPEQPLYVLEKIK